MELSCLSSRVPATRLPKPVSQWKDPRHRRGYAGERLAIAHLLRHGWKIEAHRFRLGRHDVDLVARRGSLVAFIEVKTRRSQRFGRAIEAVDRRKRIVLQRVAELWRVRFGFPDDQYRFDVISVEPPSVSVSVGDRDYRAGDFRITHIEDAWRGVEK